MVASMTSFHLFVSSAWIMSTAMLPPIGDALVEDCGAYGAIGNLQTCRQTCSLQGFVLQLGVTSAFYNLSLSIYYLLVIKYRVRESLLKKWRWLFHLPPCAFGFGFGLAFAGLPHYQPMFFACHIAPTELPAVTADFTTTEFSAPTQGVVESDNTPLLMLVILPLSTVITATCINMLMIYLHVRKTDRAANQWRISEQVHQQQQGDTGPSGRFLALESSLFRKREEPLSSLESTNSREPSGPSR